MNAGAMRANVVPLKKSVPPPQRPAPQPEPLRPAAFRPATKPTPIVRVAPRAAASIDNPSHRSITNTGEIFMRAATDIFQPGTPPKNPVANETFDPTKPARAVLPGAKPYVISWATGSGAGAKMAPITDTPRPKASAAAGALHKLRVTDPAAFRRQLTASIDRGFAARGWTLPR